MKDKKSQPPNQKGTQNIKRERERERESSIKMDLYGANVQMVKWNVILGTPYTL